MTTKIPVELSSTPGIVDSSNATAITIDSSENVGIGTSTPGSLNANANNLVVGSGSGGEGITIYSANDNNAQIFFADGTSGDAQYRGVVRYAHDVDRFEFFTSGAIKAVLDSSGNLGIATSTPGSFDSEANNLVVGSGTGDQGITIFTGSSVGDHGSIFFADATGSPKQGQIRYEQNNEVMSFFTNATEAMRIDLNGNVGIGTSAPHEMLHVEGANGTEILCAVKEDTAGALASLFFKVDSTGTDVRKKSALIFERDDPGTRGTGVLHICVDGTNDEGSASTADSKMAFQADGSILTKGNFYVSSETSAFTAGTHNGNLIQVNGQSLSSRAASNAQTHKSFANSNGTVGSITTNGSATAFNTSSDYRLKENVVTDWNGTTLLKQLKPSKFNFIADADTTLQGFLAHEVSSIVPQAVTGEKDAVYSAEDVAENIGAVEGQPNYQSIDHSKLVPLLVKTIQELEARITTLEG